MLNMREARQRASINGCTLFRCQTTGNYVVYNNSWSAAERKRSAYETDCLETAVLKTGSMRA